MAHQHKLGSSSEPIEILDTDDETQTLRGSSFIDLTQDDFILHQTPPVLQRPADKDKDVLASSAVNPRSYDRQPLELPSRQFSFTGGQNTNHTFKNRVKTSASLKSTPSQVLHSDNEDLIGERQKYMSEGDTDGEPSDVMDRSTRLHPMPVQERNPETQDDTGPMILTTRTVARELSLGLAAPQSRRTHHGSSGDDQTTYTPLLSAMEDILESIKREIGEDHALYVNNQLQDALKRSKELRAGLPDFSDAIDPFTYMPLLDERIANTQAKDQTNYINGELSGSNAELSQIPERVPRYQHFITITRSFLVPDNHKLYYEPCIGRIVDDNEVITQRWLEKLRKLYDPPEDPQASRHSESVSRLKDYLPRMLEKLDLDWDAIISYVVDMGGSVDSVTSKTSKRIAIFLIAFKNVFAKEIQDVILEIAEHFDVLSKPGSLSVNSEEFDPVRKLLQPHLLSCPMCHVYLCGIHGVYETDDSENEEMDKIDKADEGYADMNITYGGMMHRHKEKSIRSELGAVDSIYKGKPCGSNCFTTKAQAKVTIPEWSTDESIYFQALFLGVQNEPRAACILSPLMRRPCYDVQNMVTSLNTETTKSAKTESRKREKLDWYDNKRKKIRVDLDWGKKTNTHLHHGNLQPEGCEHPGISCYDAKDDCSCNRKIILCDKFCACPDDCYMKFTGCNCSQGDAPCSQDSLTCPCKLLNRECDPDLCHTCGATETTNPFNRDQDPPPNSCYNTDIQRGVRKRLLVGESSHPGDIGFGAYMAEPAKHGEFIAEYVGEIISEAEAVRRSEIYDKLKVSFIFDLNKEVTIDSYRYGNIERFINHSKKHANCKPLVKLVNGEHRIGFFATKDLDAGEELFFDYGKKFTAMHGLKEMEDVSEKKKGVALKKVREASKVMKNVTKEMGDMLKSIENSSIEKDSIVMGDDSMPTIIYSFSDEAEVDEDEEAPNDVRRPSRRPKRNVARPKKYTR